MADPRFQSTGLKPLDRLLGKGLILGDNVIFETEPGSFHHLFRDTFVRDSVDKGHNIVYIAFDESPLSIYKRLKRNKIDLTNVLVIDCFTEGKGNGEEIFRRFYNNRKRSQQFVRMDIPYNPNYFHDMFDLVAEKQGHFTRFIFDSLTGMKEMWGKEEYVRKYYTHTCPMLFDLRTIALWFLDKNVHSKEFKANLEFIAQVVIDLGKSNGDLVIKVKQAANRFSKETYLEKKYGVKDGEIVFI